MPLSRLNRILVPVDDGDTADRDAIDLALRMAKPSKGKVYAMYVIVVKRVLPLDAELQAEMEKGEKVLEQIEKMADDLGGDVEAELLQAREVGTAIVDEAVERAADLIIMGIPYKKRFGEFALSRTVEYVLKNAPCRVWLMRAPTAG